MEGSSTAFGRLVLLNALLRSLLSAWNGALQAGTINGFFGFSQSRLRWGELVVAPRADRKVPVEFWLLSEGLRMFGRAGGGLEEKIGTGRIFWQEVLQVFEVGDLVCGEN